MEADGCVWQWSGSSKTSCTQALSSCKGLLKRQCVKDTSCQWTWTGSRNGCVEMSQPGGETWRLEIETRNRQAQAYVSTAVRKWRAKQTGPSMKRWFGKASYTDPHMRKEIGRVLNSIAHVLSKAEFVFPGQCDSSTFAYVHPVGKKSHAANGNFIVYLCPLYMKSNVASQIETLTHEASHHSTALTEDICLDTKPVYMQMPLSEFDFEGNVVGEIFDVETDDGIDVGAMAMLVRGDQLVLQQLTDEDDDRECEDQAYERETCQKLAQVDPILAIRNADNFCFYIQDITDSQ